MLQTEYEFTLPKGYVDRDGTLHRHGVMRLATGADEVLPLRDARVRANSAYLIFILLARVIVRLDSLESITPKTIEEMFVADLNYLQDLYNRINSANVDGAPIEDAQDAPGQAGHATLHGVESGVENGAEHGRQPVRLGESYATPWNNSAGR